MSAIRNPIDLARQAALDFQECYSSDLLSVIVYGSAAGPEFDSKRSDVNLLLVLSSLSLAMLEKSRACQEKWMKKRFARPLFMDKDYITRSLDAFPIEFLAMKDSSTVVFGEDVFKGITIKHPDLRLQIEREIKGKWLHLMRGWLESQKNPVRLRRLLEISLKDFSHIFKSLLHLKELPVPGDRKSLFAAIATAYGIDGRAFEEAFAAAKSGDKNAVAAVFPAYSSAIESLSRVIDKL